MSALTLGLQSVGLAAALVTVPGTVELAILTVGALLPRRRRPANAERAAVLRLAVVVPAHNEESGIARTVRSLRVDGAGRAGFEVVVIADNCTDATGACAAGAGARVLTRCDVERRGKGWALDFAFRSLASEGWDAFLVVDADTVVDPGLVPSAVEAFASGVDAVQARYVVLNPEASLRTRLMNVALLAFNVLRPRGRDGIGVSAGVLGNGFGLSRNTLAEVPYEARSIVEDLEYHLRLVRAGRRVAFLDEATVRGEMPSGGKASATQRSRWEGGRLRVAVDTAPALAGEVLRGRWRLMEPLLDLLLLPLAFHASLLVLAAAAPGPGRLLGIAGLLVLTAHVAVAIGVGGGGLRDAAALLAAPFYVLWKLLLTPRIALASRRGAGWVRTDRDEGRGDRP